MGLANYDLPEDILIQVKNLAGTRTKREAIIVALKDYIRRKKMEELLASSGEIKLNWTQKKLKAYRG